MAEQPPVASDLVQRILKLKPKDYFAMLSLDVATAEFDDVKKAYKTLSLALHPDKCPDPRAKDAFAAVNAAYEHLSDEVVFKRYKSAWQRKNEAFNAANKYLQKKQQPSATAGAEQEEALQRERAREEAYQAAVRAHKEHEAKRHRAEAEKKLNEAVSSDIEKQFARYDELKGMLGTSVLPNGSAVHPAAARRAHLPQR